MKKIFKSILCITIIISMSLSMIGVIPVSAFAEFSTLGVYDVTGDRQSLVNVSCKSLNLKDGSEAALEKKKNPEETFAVTDDILLLLNEHESFVYMDMRIDNTDNPYPEIESALVRVATPSSSGPANLLGKNYRLYYAPDSDSSYVDVSDKMNNTKESSVSFHMDKLGIYLLCLDTRAYSVSFYLEEPVYDEDGNIITSGCLYEKTDDLNRNDVIDFPEIPEREGYIFTGWKIEATGYDASISYEPVYTHPQPIRADYAWDYYASWCPKDEYEPIVIEITSDEKITKGKEDGKKITLKTNYGVFLDGEDFPSALCEDYYLETDEEDKEELLSEWKSTWSVVGSDEIMVESATRIDDKTVELTLSGNSKDKYKDSDIYIEFDSSLLRGEPYDYDGEDVNYRTTKIKMDEDGVRAKMYRSDNVVTLSKQRRTSTGSSTGLTYSVTFETNGAEDIEKQTVKSGYSAKEPEIPQKEGYVFGGWYSDKELTQEFDFSTKIVKNITLYAKWDLPEKSNNEIIFTVGETKANVFGEEKENDVAPIIKGDRAFLPARFVAESLGASVEWDGETKTVTIRKDDTQIAIVIGEEYAFVNGEKVKLDYPAFIENDRTYTPIRFVAESLGAKVYWNSETKDITIEK